MIFDKELDTFLWCTLETDSEQRNDILDLLNGMPKELFELIRRILAEQVGREGLNTADETVFSEQMLSEDGMLYSIEVSYESDETEVNIKKEFLTRKDGETPYVNFCTELALYKEYWREETDEELCISNFTKTFEVANVPGLDTNEDFIPLFEFSNGKRIACGKQKKLEYEYYLIKNAEGFTVRKVNFSKFFKSADILDFSIDLGNQPEELTMEYLNKRYGNGAAVKKKNKPND